MLSNRIKGAKKFINDFFDIAGIPYLIDVRHISDDKYESFLVHHNINSKIDKPEDKLSYGELNAISLILFIVEANYRNHDLIILDDPVSSFDNNKKYAIFHHLFGSSTKDNLRGKTVLILTHDLSPIIDFLLIGKPSSDKVNASFLTLKNRVVTELPISKEDIMLSQAFEIKLAKNKN